jgi:hypothetical protein
LAFFYQKLDSKLQKEIYYIQQIWLKKQVLILFGFSKGFFDLNPQTPHPGISDGCLPTEYQKVFDPLDTLTFLAAITEKIH